MSLLMYDNNEQQEKALASKAELEKELGETVQTEIKARSTFYTAENYHQKYFLRRYKKAVQTLSALYPDEASFRDSTVTARLNGFVRGRSSMKELKREIESWGWSPEQIDRTFQVLDAVRW
ncbi:peptide-methionine (S)-S-oxide reductase [Salibacterium halotolerans]|uniref:peptide-methionine (S)-S-oxide reductase n=1 Tax=Salibacterium halotolerans TaxID=1884432 RepID=A0A1I5U0C5_9BACI|nr:peptide-methionine (S)-S-oxide reductase [Salibacterium halotolerans]